MVIAIGGVSNAEKSFIAKTIKAHFKDKTVKILCQDDFVFPHFEIPVINDQIDWESPESINFISFKNALVEAKNNFDIVIVEGFLVFYDRTVCELFDKKIFVELPKNTFMERKKEDLRWGREPEWYIQHIWNSYDIYGQKPKHDNSFHNVNGEKEFDKTLLEFLWS